MYRLEGWLRAGQPSAQPTHEGGDRKQLDRGETVSDAREACRSGRLIRLAPFSAVAGDKNPHLRVRIA